MAVARDRLPRQPLHRPPRPGHRLVAGGAPCPRRVDRRPPRATAATPSGWSPPSGDEPGTAWHSRNAEVNTAPAAGGARGRAARALRRASTPPGWPRPAQGGLLVAVLGQVGDADAPFLADAAPREHHRLAIALDVDAVGPAPARSTPGPPPRRPGRARAGARSPSRPRDRLDAGLAGARPSRLGASGERVRPYRGPTGRRLRPRAAGSPASPPPPRGSPCCRGACSPSDSGGSRSAAPPRASCSPVGGAPWRGGARLPRRVILLGQLVRGRAVVLGPPPASPVPDHARPRRSSWTRSRPRSSRAAATPRPCPASAAGAPAAARRRHAGVLLVDFLACTLRRVPLAGLLLLTVYTVPVSVTGDGRPVVVLRR